MIINSILIIIPYQNIQLTIELILAIILIGLTGIILNYRNILITMLCVELTYISTIILFLIISYFFNDTKGQVYALILLIIAAAESAIGLGLIIVLYRFGKSINFSDYQELRG